jgi:hypothetical protein
MTRLENVSQLRRPRLWLKENELAGYALSQHGNWIVHKKAAVYEFLFKAGELGTWLMMCGIFAVERMIGKGH